LKKSDENSSAVGKSEPLVFDLLVAFGSRKHHFCFVFDVVTKIDLPLHLRISGMMNVLCCTSGLNVTKPMPQLLLKTSIFHAVHSFTAIT
jgi:hypothetical protein